jgi:hypothetical protein
VNIYVYIYKYSVLSGDACANPRKTLLYYYRANNLEAVRNDWFKLVLPHVGCSYEGFLPLKDGKRGRNSEKNVVELALYDLRRDLAARFDVKALYPEIMAELMRVVENAREDLGDNLTNRNGSNRRPAGSVVK